MIADDLVIAVLGASGLAAEALLTSLGESPLGPAVKRAFASRGSKTESVEVAGRQIAVEPLTNLGDGDVHLAFSCLPFAVAQKVAAALAMRGVIVVDVGDNLAGVSDAPLVLPGVFMADPREVASAGIVRTPSPAGWLLARLVAPLRDVGLTGVSGVVNLPAGAWGRAAIEELSEQVVASFNLKEPPRRLFAEGLAFDTLIDDTDAGEWSAREQLAAAEVLALTGVERVGVQVVTQPLFAGASLGLHLRGSGLDVDAAEAAWNASPGVKAVQQPSALRPRKAIGKRSVFYGALRPDPAGDGVHVWAVADTTMGAAGEVPVKVAEWLVQAGVVGGPHA